jgi:catechol 2,3-dioxygenase-like lactoylglutathione lyase family enzyme
MAQNDIRKIQTQGVHHITIIGADRQTSIDFWEGVLGMPFIFDQPNLDDPNQGHLYFDPGDGRLITIFTNEDRKPDATPVPEATGLAASPRAQRQPGEFWQVAERLDARGVSHSGPVDRGFMDSIYFRDPLGLRIELASYRFVPPEGYREADVMIEAHKIRVARGDHHIDKVHLADAIEALVERGHRSLSEDRGAKNPY